MLTYTYSAKDDKGNVIKAEVEAASAQDAAKLLVSKKLFPIDITERKTTMLSGESLAALSRITAKDRLLFTRQLATLVKAGLPLAKAMEILERQIEKPKMKKLVHSLSVVIQGGNTLSSAMSAYPDVFSRVYISMVEAGEASGNLDETLIRLANQEEKTNEINTKIRSAFTYPIVVLFVLIAVMVLMITLVLPQVGKMYVDMNKPLPMLTQMMLSMATIFTKFWPLFIAMIVAAGIGVRVYLKTPNGQALFDRVKLKVPGFKVLLMKMYMARFSRTLGSLVGSGVPVLQALSITATSMNNVHMEKEVNSIATKIKGGAPISKPIQESLLFIPLVGQMLSVGEQTGTIGESLNRVADYYEDEVDDAVRNISTLIEPATMILLGGMVAFLIAAVLLPIYGLVNSF